MLSPSATRSSANASRSSCSSASRATSSASAAGSTIAPSSSPTIRSPGITSTPAQAMGMFVSRGRCSRPSVAACGARA